jgi:hypothetical protein
MYASVRTYAVLPEFVDQLVRHQSEVKQVLREIDGFRAYYLIRTGDGGAISVSVYDDQAGADRSTQAAREWILANLPDADPGPPLVAGGEVVIDASV